MKRFGRKALFAAAAVASLATLSLAGCSDDDEDEGGGTGVPNNLPASVGTNEFNGTKWTANGATLEFGESTATSTSGGAITTYAYSFDSKKHLVHMQFRSRTNLGITGSSVDDAINIEKSGKGSEWTADMEAYYRDKYTALFCSVESASYAINGTSGTLTCYYFTGKFPTSAKFCGSGSPFLELDSTGELKFSSDGTSCRAYIHTVGDDGSFSTTLYKRSDKTKIGTISGRLTSTGTGTSGCTAKITFTSVPDGITAISTGTEYEMSQGSPNTVTYTVSR